MSAYEILGAGGLSLIVLLSLIQITPIKINPWTAIGKWIGKCINGEVIKKVDDLGADLKKLRSECEEREAIQCRTRITRFAGEASRHPQTSDSWRQVLLDCDCYENYCNDKNPAFRNGVATASIEFLREKYKRCLAENDFYVMEGK